MAEKKAEIGQPIVKDIYDVSDEFLSQLKTWTEQSGLRVPVSQLVGSASVPATPTAQDLVDALVSMGLISQNP